MHAWLLNLIEFYFVVKCMKQDPGSEPCAYIVMENIRYMTEKINDKTMMVRKYYLDFVLTICNIFIYWSSSLNNKISEKRDKLDLKDRMRALQEEIAGFLLREVIDKTGEFPYHL